MSKRLSAEARLARDPLVKERHYSNAATSKQLELQQIEVMATANTWAVMRNQKVAKLADISKSLGRRRLDGIRKEKAMKKFRQATVTFIESLAQLKRLEGPGRITQALRVVEEQSLTHAQTPFHDQGVSMHGSHMFMIHWLPIEVIYQESSLYPEYSFVGSYASNAGD
jgi:soluble cytochrome b562